MNALNLAPIWAILTPTVSKGFLALFAFATAKLNAFLAQHRMSQAQDDLDQAVGRIQEVAKAWWKSFEDHNKSIVIPGSKMNEFVSQIFEVAPAAEKILNVSPDTVATLLQAAFTNWAKQAVPATGVKTATGGDTTEKPAS